MLEEKNGRVIINIEFTKKGIEILLDNNDKIVVSSTTYSDYYLYKGKILSLDEVNEIKKANEISKLKQYVIDLLIRKMYSRQEIINKLIKKQASKETINLIIGDLEKKNFINDKKYCDILIEEYDQKNYGINKIKHNLLEKGIEKKLVEKIEVNHENELRKADISLKEFVKSKNNKSYTKLNESTYNYLINKGFQVDVVSQAMNKISSYATIENDKLILLKALEKYLIMHRVDLSDTDAREKVIKRYKAKGFSYNLIIECLKEIEDGEIC